MSNTFEQLSNFIFKKFVLKMPILLEFFLAYYENVNIHFLRQTSTQFHEFFLRTYLSSFAVFFSVPLQQIFVGKYIIRNILFYYFSCN